ncbi:MULTISPECIES: ABC exporter membrane fusion protein [Nostocales]|uniref:ABC exporter membrane fusion protein n=3 Tax=Nostocales TaxID=1161 RepID=A0A0C1QT26_9CYAN|nr:ABC exporter membrane fusion protein [Tolypothrix bouteillei]KAF3883896.1 ABC exporter membrane fusion protein [Tolypothrix bouteillei VB521301]
MINISKQKNQWLMAMIAGATAIMGGTVVYSISQFGHVSQKPAPVVTTSPMKKVTALGRLEPEAKVIKLSAPLALDGDRLTKLLVEEGDRVQVGQVVAILDSRDKLHDALKKAQEQVKTAQAKLAQVQAGAKRGEIAAQKATIERLKAQLQGEITTQKAIITRRQSELNIARAEYERYQMLYREGAESALNFDNKRLAFETAQTQLMEAQANQNRTADTLQAEIAEAKATLDKIAEVRPVDVRAAQAEVDDAIASVKQAQTDLEKAYIRSPIAGNILKIHTREGEKMSDSGIVDVAQTDRMVAVAEVYQSDIGKVKVGQKAIVTGQAVVGKLQGVVSHIGLQVNKQNVFSNQPGENLDKRVVEVKIRLNPADSKKVAGLTNLQVQTAIEL